jgi:hypothetical protein
MRADAGGCGAAQPKVAAALRAASESSAKTYRKSLN